MSSSAKTEINIQEEGKKVISYCLYGDKPLYTFGMILNAMDAQRFYPGWIVRVYCGQSVPADIVQILKSFENVEIIEMSEQGNRTAMFWRFYAASDPTVSVMLSRDADSRLSVREATAVSEWLATDKGFHTMRDNTAHGTPILGGMWGVRRGVLPQMKEWIDNYEKGDFWQVDQNFLRDLIAPLVRHNWVEHDPFFAHKPFTVPRIGREFIGEPVSNDYHRVLSVYPELGKYLNGSLYILTRGGFGNILFNYLMGYSLGKKYHMTVKYVPSVGNRPPITQYPLFQSLVEFAPAPTTNFMEINEQRWTYYPVSVPDPSKTYVVDGYFQSYKHSEAYIDEIRVQVLEKLYKPHIKDWFDSSVKKDESDLEKFKSVLVHVRRGDYLPLPDYHPVPPETYYAEAFNKFGITKENHKLLVFSDDIPYISQWALLQNYNHVIVPFADVEETFYLMTLCEDFIITNSSLSLLAYHFSPNKEKRVCMPQQWFGKSGPAYKHEDLVKIPHDNSSVFVIDY
jgi:hypothetical protein